MCGAFHLIKFHSHISHVARIAVACVMREIVEKYIKVFELKYFHVCNKIFLYFCLLCES